MRGVPFFRKNLDWADALRHAPAPDHHSGQVGAGLKVAFSARGDCTEDQFLCSHPAQGTDDSALEIVLVVAVPVRIRS